MIDNKRKCMVICLLALFIGLIGIVLPEQENIAFEYVVNNTDLYNNGRITNTTYTANNSAIQLFLIFHVVGTGASLVVDTNLSINGTVVEDRDYRTTAGLGIHEHFSMTAHIPKGANYSVTNSSNLETIEWREYPILTGRNGTLSVNITQGGGTGSQNLSQVLNQGNQAIDQKINFTNTGKWLQVGYNNQTGLMEINTSSIFYYKQGSTFLGFTGLGYAYSAYNNKPMKFGESGTNYSQIEYNSTHGTRWQGAGTANKNLNITGFDKVNMYQDIGMNNNNISGVLNISDTIFLPGSKKLWVNKINNYSNASGGYYPGAVSNNDLFSFIFNSPQPAATHNLISFEIVANLASEWNYFLAKGARGEYNSTTRNATNLTSLQTDDLLLRFGVSGFDNTSGWSGTKAYIDFRVEDNWNATWQPVKMDFYTTNSSGSATNKRLTIWANGSLQNYGLGGSGNAYKCVDSKGIDYRGNPGC